MDWKTKRRLVALRRAAAARQQHRCWYCHFPIYEKRHLAPFLAQHGISAGEAARFQCTAEHLVAHCDGGLVSSDNIVAACLFCNRTRHQRRRPKPADDYLRYVAARVGRGRWHHRDLHRLLAGTAPIRAAA